MHELKKIEEMSEKDDKHYAEQLFGEKFHRGEERQKKARKHRRF